jgi:phosphate transport system substrate-binding protein
MLQSTLWDKGSAVHAPSMKPLDHGRFFHLLRIAYRRGVIALAALLLLHHAAAQTPSTRAGGLTGTRTIHVASLGEGSSAEALRARVIDRLNSSGKLKVVEGASGADFLLRGDSNIWATGNISLNPRTNSARQTIYEGYLSVDLLNKSDQTLWSYLVTPSHFRTTSITNDLADHMVARLLETIASGAIANGAASSANPAVGPGTHIALHAAGSTLAAPLYLKWFESAGFTVAYDAIGSAAGIEQLAAGKVDFAASDMPLTAENTPAQLRVVQIPTVLGGVVPIYNLPSLGRNLRLTPQVLAGIYSGAITKWNDPRIVEANRGAHLPDAQIAVVHRSDGSGTTFVWASFLSLASSEWKAQVGAGASVRWPVGAGAAGSNGVADLVKTTQNSIGYVELIYAIQHELNYASVRNPAGEFIKADLASITAAAADASGSGSRLSILNAGGRDAYPISTFTWLLVPTQGLSSEKRSAIVALLNWMLTSGQKECASLGYAPLPRDIAASQLQVVNAIK